MLSITTTYKRGRRRFLHNDARLSRVCCIFAKLGRSSRSRSNKAQVVKTHIGVLLSFLLLLTLAIVALLHWNQQQQQQQQYRHNPYSVDPVDKQTLRRGDAPQQQHQSLWQGNKNFGAQSKLPGGVEKRVDVMRNTFSPIRKRSGGSVGGGGQLFVAAICELPRIDPWDESILPYVQRNVPQLKCERVQPQLTYLHEGRLYINASELSLLSPQPGNISNMELTALTKQVGKEEGEEKSGVDAINTQQHHCLYRCYASKEGGSDSSELEFTPWDFLQNATEIREFEFVEVVCYKSTSPAPTSWPSPSWRPIYSNNHAQIIPRLSSPLLLEEDGGGMERKTAKMNGHGGGGRANSGARRGTSRRHHSRSNVLLFVLDSVSNLHWHRHLPETLQVLQTLYGPLFEFKGMTTVGDSSFPIANAFLKGRSLYPRMEDEEDGEEKDEEDTWKKEKKSSTTTNFTTSDFDEWPFIWKNFADEGYATLYAADETQFELFGYYSSLFSGFVRHPIDHVFMPYYLQMYESEFYKYYFTYKCYGNRPMYAAHLDYLGQLLRGYAGKKPVFALSWISELSHDHINDLCGGLIKLGMADADFAEFFRAHHHLLKDSFVFVLGDHGHRFDEILQTRVGRVEKKMPYFAMHLPEWLTAHSHNRHRYKEVLEAVRGNSMAGHPLLTTHYDLYITLRDLLHLEAELIKWDLSPRRKNSVKSPLAQWRQQDVEFYRREYAPHGLSLLRPLPQRHCHAADVPMEYCTCLAGRREVEVDAGDPKVVEAAKLTVEVINKFLEKTKNATIQSGRHCAILVLKEVKSAHVQSTTTIKVGTYKESSLLYYRLVVETSPSGAMFEALVKQQQRRSTNGVDDYHVEVVGKPSRINAYKNQAACIDDTMLRPYCYCTR